MNYVITRPAVLRIVRSLAAAQIMTDRCGEGDSNHPLTFFLDSSDGRTELTSTLFHNACYSLIFSIMDDLDDIEIPDRHGDDFILSIRSTKRHSGRENVILALMEQLVAYLIISLALETDPSERSQTIAETFRTLAADGLRRLIAFRFPSDMTLRPGAVY